MLKCDYLEFNSKWLELFSYEYILSYFDLSVDLFRAMVIQWNLYAADTCLTDVTVYCREVSPVRRCHLLSHYILEENICPMFVGVFCIEVSVNGGSIMT